MCVLFTAKNPGYNMCWKLPFIILKFNAQLLAGNYVPLKHRKGKAVSLFKTGHKRGFYFHVLHTSYLTIQTVHDQATHLYLARVWPSRQPDYITKSRLQTSHFSVKFGHKPSVLKLEAACSYKTAAVIYVTTKYCNTDEHYLSNPHP